MLTSSERQRIAVNAYVVVATATPSDASWGRCRRLARVHRRQRLRRGRRHGGRRRVVEALAASGTAASPATPTSWAPSGDERRIVEALAASGQRLIELQRPP
jgi:hypothetical protein